MSGCPDSRHDVRSPFRYLIPGLALLIASVNGWAAPFEIKVHDDLIVAEGQQALSVHSNYAKPLGNGGDSNAFQSILEYSYGLTHSSELGVHLFASNVNQAWYANGGKIAYQYVPAHDEEGFWHYSIKQEVTSVRPVGSANQVFYELTPIVGVGSGPWRMTLNPVMNVPIKTGYKQVLFEPAVKIGYSISPSASIGTEYYVEAGPLSRMLPHGRRDEVAYLVLDAKVKKAVVNFGFGKGVNDVSDRRVIKMIVDYPF
jgi:hypothetical protein